MDEITRKFLMTDEELKEARRKLGHSQQELGEKLDLTREWVGKMERGLCAIDIRTELAVRYLLNNAEKKHD